MLLWCKKIAFYLAGFVFFALLCLGLLSQPSFSLRALPIIVLKASLGFVIFYFLGLIIADIILKAIKHTVEDRAVSKLEGGLVSRFVDNPDQEQQPKQTP